MKITRSEKIGQTQKRKAVVKAWRNNPGNFDKAVHAAAHYAKRDGRNMVVVPGNSYGHKIFHITTEVDSISKYTVKSSNNPVALVTPIGEVFQAIAED